MKCKNVKHSGRIAERNRRYTEEQTKKRKRGSKAKIFILAIVMVMLIPFSAFAAEEMDWGWTQGINTAVEKNSAVELNEIFEYDNHKIKFENAVWEDYALLVSYSVLDADINDTFMPSQVSLVNEEGKSISQGHGQENYGNGKGVLEFDLNNKLVKGDKFYLKVHTVRELKIDKPDYMYTMVLDKSLGAEGAKYNIGRELKTDYGTLKFVTASNLEGKLTIDYTFEQFPEIKELAKADGATGAYIGNIFPEITLKDAKKNILHVSGRDFESNEQKGKLYFDGMPELNRPVTISIMCDEKLVKWSLPIPIKKSETEIITVKKEYKGEGGIFKINNLHLGSASTYLDYEFIPEKGLEVTRLDPVVSMTNKDKIVKGLNENDGLTGKIIFRYPIKKNDLKGVTFYLDSIRRSVSSGESINIDFDKSLVDYKVKVDGSEVRAANIIRKDGKTSFDLEVSDNNRKFDGFDVGLKADTSNLSWSSSSNSEMVEKKLDETVKNNLESKYNLKQPFFKKTIIVDGQYKKLEVVIENLIYNDIYNSEIKIN